MKLIVFVVKKISFICLFTRRFMRNLKLRKTAAPARFQITTEQSTLYS